MRFYGDLRDVVEGFMNVNDQIVVVAFVSNNGSLLNVFKSAITMPINFITSKMEKPSDVVWSERTLETTPINPLGDEDWFLVNVDRLGFYRVYYDDTNWRRLTSAIKSQRDTFSSQTIAQLIDDSLSFARDSLLSYRTVLELVEILSNETSMIVWSAASLNLLELNNRLRDLDFYQHFVVSYKNR
jgi:aminopeptidase N